MAGVSQALKRVEADLAKLLPDESILAACRAVGHAWRERQLGPVRTIHLFVLQVMACDTAINHLRLFAGEVFSAAAYCEARMRLPLAALQALLRDSSLVLRDAAADAGKARGQAGVSLWRGPRAFLVDGSGTIAPDTPGLQKAFGQPVNQKPGCGLPVPKLLALFDAFTGMVVEMLGFPLYTHEQSKVWMLHPLLAAGDLLVGDRGFCSFAHPAMPRARGVGGCFRCHQRQTVDFRPHRKSRDRSPKNDGAGRPSSEFVRRLGRHDQVVRWKRPPAKPAWTSAGQWQALPPWPELRELRYALANRGRRTRPVTIATTLLDPELYPKDAVAELYEIRWQAETRFAELKTTPKMRRLKCKTEDGIRKELAAYCLAYNMVRAVTAAAGLAQGVAPERVSFIDALRWLLWAAPGEPIPRLVVNPSRKGRHEPRVIKDLQDTYRKMTSPRSTLRKTLKKQAKTVK